MKILGKDYLLVTLDFETYYGPKYSLSSLNTFEYIRHPQFSIHGVGIKIEDRPSAWFSDTEEALNLIDTEAEKAGLPIALLCHNTYFDGTILDQVFDWHPDLYLDTMCMSKGMFPVHSASLDKLAERLWPSDKTMRKGKELVAFKGITTDELYSMPPLLNAMREYCVGDGRKKRGDVGLTYEAFLRMLPFYPDRELHLIHLTLQFQCEPRIMVDIPRTERCRDNAAAKRDALIEASGVAVTTLSSNDKFAAWIAKQGIEVPMKPSKDATVLDDKTGEQVPKMIPALGKDDLEFTKLRKDYPHLEHVWAARVAAKSVGEITRAERFLQTAEQCNGFMPVALKYYSAHTGRYGGGEKLNLQNLGRGSELRRSLVAPGGELIYVSDSSNIEARMLAWLAGQDNLVELFRSGGDVYSDFASKLFGYAVNKHDHKDERFIGKVCVLGLGYGMGWKTFQTTLAKGALGGPPVFYDEAQARHAVQLYRAANPMIVAYWKAAEQAIVDMYMGNEREWGPLKIYKNCLVMPNGLALQYPQLRPIEASEANDWQGEGWEYWEGSYWKKLYGGLLTENITQALSRIVLFEQMLNINEKVLLPVGGRVVLNVHDEIIGVGPSFGAKRTGFTPKGKDIWENNEQADELFARITEQMKTAPAWCRDLPLDSEGGYAPEYSK
ncbi:DNA polymerase [Pseudomonas luteola]|uniref:DNA polymerase n=1 Tax=Pseudomonas luteola TaxID=47886 RepID=UPI003A8C13A5